MMPTVTREQRAQEIVQLITSLKTDEERIACLKAILTKTELTQIFKRLQIIQLLQNEVPYDQISRKLKVSSATIASVSQAVSDVAQSVIVEKMRRNHQVSKLTNRLWQFIPSWLKA